jgi:hypothetical protein
VLRADEIELLPEELARPAAKGWNALAKLASLAWPCFRDSRDGADDPPEDRMHTYRRLYSEAYTLAAAVLRARVERIQAIRLRGIVLEVGREASHALVGAAVQLFDDIMLKYIGREQCTMSS